jgi:hypothetical protein
MSTQLHSSTCVIEMNVPAKPRRPQFWQRRQLIPRDPKDRRQPAQVSEVDEGYPIGLGAYKASVNNLNWHALMSTGNVVPRVRCIHIGLNSAGSDGVHGDAAGPKVLGKASDKTADGSFAASVQGVVWNPTHGRGDGRHQDNTPTSLEVLLAIVAIGDELGNTHIFGEMLISLLGNEKLAFGVEIEDAIIDFLSHFLFWHEGLSAAVGDDLDTQRQVRRDDIWVTYT